MNATSRPEIAFVRAKHFYNPARAPTPATTKSCSSKLTSGEYERFNNNWNVLKSPMLWYGYRSSNASAMYSVPLACQRDCRPSLLPG